MSACRFYAEEWQGLHIGEQRCRTHGAWAPGGADACYIDLQPQYIPPPYETPRSTPMKRKIIIAVVAIAAAIGLSGCESKADKAAENLSIAAENFEIQRNIVAVNGITDEVLFMVEGRCSIERDGDLVVTCKHGEGDIRKHYVGLSDNVTWISTQVEGFDADEFRTRIILKPENIIPNFDLETSVG